MELITNELSLHGQFTDIPSFKAAIDRLITLRNIARRFGREVYCHKNISHALVMPHVTMPQAVQGLSMNERRALLSWINHNGPFWEDNRTHSPDDYLEYGGEVVTDTAIGEAAWCRLHGIDRELISINPSNWLHPRLTVEWKSDAGQTKTVDVANHWDGAALEAALLAVPPPLVSWSQVETLSRGRHTNLTFAHDTFSPLQGHPFVSGAANRIVVILDILNQLKSCFDADGTRTAEGHEIYQEYFTGKKGDGGRGAIFTDSSDSEKSEFKNALTFPNPSDPTTQLFCPWHGKIQTPQFRVHFSWPVRASEPLYIVYIGEKLTKR